MMWELFSLSPVPITLILIVLSTVIAAGIAGWHYSERTRRLVVFVVCVLGILALAISSVLYIRMKWFPVPYL